MAENIRFERFGETKFVLKTKNGSTEVKFPLNGKHNILNALSAAAVGLTFEMPLEEITRAVETAEPPPQRGEVLNFAAGFTVVNDSYNSNPDALISMVQTLVEGGEGVKRKIVVAGEMRELGEEAAVIHEKTGRKLSGIGIDALYGIEGFAENLVKGAAENGLNETTFYENSTVAAEEFVNEVRAGDLILVKGSRGVKTEKIIEKLREKFELEK